jgi:hypothetical protein
MTPHKTGPERNDSPAGPVVAVGVLDPPAVTVTVTTCTLFPVVLDPEESVPVTAFVMVCVAVTSRCPAASEIVVEGEADVVEAPAPAVAVAPLDPEDRMEDAAATAEAEATEPADPDDPAEAAIEETELELTAEETDGMVPGEMPDDPAATEDEGVAPEADIGGLPEAAEDTGCTGAAGDWAEDVTPTDCAAEEAGVTGVEAGAAELGDAEDTTGAADELA